MMHRTLSVLALLSASALALTACASGSGSEPAAQDGELTGEIILWMYPVIKDETASKDFWEAAEKDFEKANPAIDLTIELQTFDKRDEQISAALAANTGPDIVLITPDQAATYLNVGALRRSTTRSPTNGMPSTPARWMPRRSTTNCTASRSSRTSPPPRTTPRSSTRLDWSCRETWDEIRDVAPELAERGISVLDYVGSPEQTLNLSFYPFLWQAGGTVFSDDGTKSRSTPRRASTR